MAGTKYRGVMLSDGTTLQSSITVDSADYVDQRMNVLFLGVVLNVYPSDSDKNRSGFQTTDRKGYRHECTVLVTDDGQDGYMVLDNVAITPDVPIGLDDYQEKLPKGSSILVDGQDYDATLNQIDPYDLDGDWCVVGFLGGRIDSPFVVRWWPHARNSFDPATSGVAGDETSLVQLGRYFRRINGVETVISSKGDILVSTTYTGASLNPGGDPTFGRFPRNVNPDVGGRVRLTVKPTQTFEIDFNPQQDGIGAVDAPDPDLPQTNPPQVEPEAEQPEGLPPETYLYVDRDAVDLYVPVFVSINSQDQMVVKATNFVTITTEDYIDLTATNKITLEAEKLYLGQAAEDSEEDPVVLGEKLREWFLTPFQVLSPFGPLKIDPTTVSPIGSSPYDDTLSEKSFVE
jgi:hypothetical protein